MANSVFDKQVAGHVIDIQDGIVRAFFHSTKALVQRGSDLKDIVLQESESPIRLVWDQVKHQGYRIELVFSDIKEEVNIKCVFVKRDPEALKPEKLN